MPNLKAIKSRLSSVRSTQKITSAMKMVANAKLRQVQMSLMGTKSYVHSMTENVMRIKSYMGCNDLVPSMWQDTTAQKGAHLYVVISGDRGLCGNYNSLVTQHVTRAMKAETRDIKFCFIGQKSGNFLQKNYMNKTINQFSNDVRNRYDHITAIAAYLYAQYKNSVFATCSIIYTDFKTAMSADVKEFSLIPFQEGILSGDYESSLAIYDVEPVEKEWLDQVAYQNMVAQLYYATLSSKASEEAARMVAMDNATRNASDMIKRLQLVYNRTRQAQITRELIEIVAGAEAV